MLSTTSGKLPVPNQMSDLMNLCPGDCGALVDVHSVDQLVASLENLAINPELFGRQKDTSRAQPSS